MTPLETYNAWIAAHPVVPPSGDPSIPWTYSSGYSALQQSHDAWRAMPDSNEKYAKAQELFAPYEQAAARENGNIGLPITTYIAQVSITDPTVTLLYNYIMDMRFSAEKYLADGQYADGLAAAFNAGKDMGTIFNAAFAEFEAYARKPLRGVFSPAMAKGFLMQWQKDAQPSKFAAAMEVVIPALLITAVIVAAAAVAVGASGTTGGSAAAAGGGTAGTATTTANTVAAASTPAAAPASSTITVAGLNTGISTGIVGLNTLTTGIINGAITGAATSAISGGSGTAGAQAGAKAGAVNSAAPAAQQVVTQVTPLMPSGGSLDGFSNPLAGMSNPLAGLNLNLGSSNLSNPLAGANVSLGSLTPKNVALGPAASLTPGAVPGGVAEVTPMTAPGAGFAPLLLVAAAALAAGVVF